MLLRLLHHEFLWSTALRRRSLAALSGIGCEKVYREQTSSVGVRNALMGAIEFSREGDTLVVTKFDRPARSVRHLGEIIETLEAKSAGLKVLDLGLDTGTVTGKLMLNVLDSVAQFEREMMLERQREGIAKARREGRYRGRAPAAMRRRNEVLAKLAEGVSKRQIARELGISARSVYRAAALSS